MNLPSENTWKPDPELLAAYFDGELEGRNDVADMRERIERWLETNPAAAEQWDEHLRLQKLWLDTTPAEPSDTAWKETLERIDNARHQPIAATSPRRPWLAAGVVAASIVLVVGLLFGGLRSYLTNQPNPDPVANNPPIPLPVDDAFEVLAVATADEVIILRIEGDDTDAVIVGTMPVTGPLELASSGEVCISCKCPRVNVRQDPPHRPMVWARASAE